MEYCKILNVGIELAIKILNLTKVMRRYMPVQFVLSIYRKYNLQVASLFVLHNIHANKNNKTLHKTFFQNSIYLTRAFNIQTKFF